MAIVTGLTKRLDIPHEEGGWMIIRQLSWRQRERAQDARTDAVLHRVKDMGGMGALRDLQSDQARPDVQEAMADPALTYDKSMVLQFGIVQWSYSDEVTPDLIDELDEVTAAWAVREILAFSGPASEDGAKNG